MNSLLSLVKNKVYSKCSLYISDFQIEAESKAYQACQFNLNGAKIICRNSKITPKKTGQFVTFWKREQNGPTEPFSDNDPFDFFVVNVISGKHVGQFVFPKNILIRKQIISTSAKEGKRGFRVYPSWDHPESKLAKKTQKWQLTYFYSVEGSTSPDQIELLYKLK